jgi:hypothetical protein
MLFSDKNRFHPPPPRGPLLLFGAELDITTYESGKHELPVLRFAELYREFYYTHVLCLEI